MAVFAPLLAEAQSLDNPVQIVQNLGQIRNVNKLAVPEVKYYSSTRQHGFYFQNRSVVYVKNKPGCNMVDSMYYVTMDFEGANASQNFTRLNSWGIMNYYLDYVNLSGVPTCNNLRYNSLYGGINATCTNAGDGVGYSFSINPSVANLANLKMKWTNATSVSLVSGGLKVSTPLGDFEYEAPEASQIVGGVKVNVPVSYQLNGQTVSFSFGSYNTTATITLLTNPKTVPAPPPVTYPSTFFPNWVTFLPSEFYVLTRDIFTDNKDNIWVTGMGALNVYPLTGALGGGAVQQFIGYYDAIVIKFDKDRKNVYGTYFGGSGGEDGLQVTVDDAGYTYIVGQTTSNDIYASFFSCYYPVSVSYSPTGGNNIVPDGNGNLKSDLFFAKLDGNLMLGQNFPSTFWSYFGHTGVEWVDEMEFDKDENLYIGGSVEFRNSGDKIPAVSKSGSYNYAYTYAGYNGYSGPFVGFVAKLKPTFITFNSLPNSKLLTVDWATGIEGTVMVTDLVAKGTSVMNGATVYVAGDHNRNNVQASTVYPAPYTGNSPNGEFPIVDPNPAPNNSEYLQKPVYANNQEVDNFVMQFRGDGKLQWASCFGGLGEEGHAKLIRDKDGSLYLWGSTNSALSGAYIPNGTITPPNYPNFPTRTLTVPGVTGIHNDNSYNGNYDCFIARFKSNYELDWSTYWGSNQQDLPWDISAGGSKIYLTGWTAANGTVTGFPNKNKSGYYYQFNFPGTENDFMAHILLNGKLDYATYYGNGGSGPLNRIANSTDDQHFFFTGPAYEGFTSLLKDLPGTADYFFGKWLDPLLSPSCSYYSAVGNFKYVPTCVGCQRSMVEADENIPGLSVAPVPLNDQSMLQNPERLFVESIRCLGIDGTLKYTEEVKSSEPLIPIGTLHTLPQGIYLIQVITAEGPHILKVLK